ncbi:MAG: formylglycine-generating enzyme family protein [Planctomycetes bacterium]|nr:formylglycine-generating enzyme family protein [Planctomycetota bacterium]
MSRGLLLSVCLLAVCAATTHVVVSADEPKTVKVIAAESTSKTYLLRLKKDDSGVVIRSAAELVAHSAKPDDAKDPAVQKAMAAELAKFFKVKSIDWNKQMVVVVEGHDTRGEFGAIKFDPPEIKGKVLQVFWKQEHRVTRASHLGVPMGFALVERFEGEVVFFPRITTNSLDMALMLIPSGKFTMGSPKGEEDRHDEEAHHEVEITRPFYMGKHEVTVGQFKAFVKDANDKTEGERDGKGGRAFDGKEFVQKPVFTWKNLHFTQTDDHPVVVVSWNDAVAFCEWLSKKEGRTYRLPTEAEWEYACRAGTKTRFHTGDKDDDLQLAGNTADASLKAKWKDVFWAMSWDDGFAFTAPVGQFKANAFGLYDMHGNAWEWCSDWYAEGYYPKSPVQDPQGPANGKERVTRGGAWSTQPKFCRAAFRDRHEPGYRSDCVGFRVVLAESR